MSTSSSSSSLSVFDVIREYITTLMFGIQRKLRSKEVDAYMKELHSFFAWCGIPPPYIGAEELAVGIAAAFGTLVLYFVFFGHRHRNVRRKLRQDLDSARDMVMELESKLQRQVDDDRRRVKDGQEREIRVWMDGAFDMMHYGHMNAFRQGRALGTYLVVGVNDDESIAKCKGSAPVMNDAERTATVAGCKFVDAIEPKCPYIMTSDYLDFVIKKHKIDYVVHGDDPCIVDGKDVYETAKRLGKYRSIPRTEGVSTTDIVGRMLLLTRDHHNASTNGAQLSSTQSRDVSRPSRFFTTNSILRLFSQDQRPPQPNDKVVYIDGAWDMFHAGHVDILKRARALGDYLIVGVFNDALVNRHRGSNRPIMNLHERVLSVLGCKHVDDVLIDAPWALTKEMIASLKLKVVVSGTKSDTSGRHADCYEVPRSMGIYHQIDSEIHLSVDCIVDRIKAQEERFVKKYQKKTAAEAEYYAERYGTAQNEK